MHHSLAGIGLLFVSSKTSVVITKTPATSTIMLSIVKLAMLVKGAYQVFSLGLVSLVWVSDHIVDGSWAPPPSMVPCSASHDDTLTTKLF